MDWRFSRMAGRMKSSVIRETLKITKKPGIISFGGGLPASELFPSEELIEASTKVLKENSSNALQYATTEGYPKLRKAIADVLADEGISASPDDILITGGSQQGLDLVGRIFIDEGETVVTAEPTYLGAIQAFNAFNPRYITLPSDDDGMTVDGLEELVEKNRPRFIYLVPTFQNPDGRTLPLSRRKKIVEIAKKYSVPIIEDDPYSYLFYEGTVPPPIKSIYPDGTILLGTFSKLLAPGLRIAWTVAPCEAYEKLVKQKQGADLHTNTFAQYVVYEYLAAGHLKQHIEDVKKLYSRRMKIMLECIERYFPEEVSWTKPTGGLFLWVVLPEKVNATELLPKAVENNVAYIPGSAFYPNGGGHNTIRMNFSKPTESEIEIGIKKLGEVFKEALKK
ncbi:MAG: hypothetical protein B6D65_01645 [candidate division Zixibacteria bacterium 4484_93]|nr:MAG: hypothetical protein B6D65_01645 [candidate division Zixibacteria bacterium 4484_93]